MKRRRVLVAVLAVLVLAVGLGWFLWLRHAEGPLLRLKVVRQTVEQGKPVVFFRVEVADRRRIQICGVERVFGDKTENPAQFPSNGSNGFWAPSQSWPMGDPAKGRKELGVLAPTNAALWKLRVRVLMETPSSGERFNQMPGLWRSLRSTGVPFFKATWDSWNAFYGIGSEVIESEPITTVPAM